jgi:hypothetical protein
VGFRSQCLIPEAQADLRSMPCQERHTSSRSDTNTLTLFHSHDATQEKVNKQTRLNARLATALNGVFEAVYRLRPFSPRLTRLGNQKTSDEVKLAVTFPWLEGNDTNSTLSTRQDRPYSFNGMLEMINKARRGKKGIILSML